MPALPAMSAILSQFAVTRFTAYRGGAIYDIIEVDGEQTLAGFLDYLRAESGLLGTTRPDGRPYLIVWGCAFLGHAADPTITIIGEVVS